MRARSLRKLVWMAWSAVFLGLVLRTSFAQTTSEAVSRRLAEAAMRGDVVSVRRLLRGGANPNQGSLGMPLLAAVRHPPVVRLLLTAGADPNAAISTEFEDSIFMAAVGARALPAVKLMLAHGARINQEGRYGNRALDFAVQNKDRAMIRFLKRHKAVFGSRINRGG